MYSCILYKNPLNTQIKEIYNLRSWNYMYRGTIKEFIRFTSAEISARIDSYDHHIYKYKDHDIHGHSYKNDKYSVVIMTDNNYNKRVALNAINDILACTDNIDIIFKKYIDPIKIDQMMKIDKDIGDVRNIVVEDIEKLLKRGENIEELFNKSEQISYTSRAFASKTKELNKCCNII